MGCENGLRGKGIFSLLAHGEGFQAPRQVSSRLTAAGHDKLRSDSAHASLGALPAGGLAVLAGEGGGKGCG